MSKSMDVFIVVHIMHIVWNSNQLIGQQALAIGGQLTPTAPLWQQCHLLVYGMINDIVVCIVPRLVC